MNRKDSPPFNILDQDPNAPDYMLRGVGVTETIDLNNLLTEDVTRSGSLNLRDDIWGTTFGKVIQALPIPVLLIDQSHNILVANKAWGKIAAGYEKILGNPFTGLFAKHSVALEGESLIEKVFSTRKTATWKALLHIGNSKAWARFTFRPIRTKDQRFLLVMVEDLSLEKKQLLLERKHKEEFKRRIEEATKELRKKNEELAREVDERRSSEKALKESEERFRAIFESHHAVLLVIDPETGRIEDCSPGACAFYGYDRKELKKKNITEINILAPEKVLDRMRMAKSLNRKYFDFQHRLASGEIRDVEVCSGPAVIAGKTVLFSVINDVTERKRAEDLLQESEKRYRTLFESAGDSICIIEAEGERAGQIVSANPAAARMHGYTVQELLSLKITDLDTPESARSFPSRLERTLRGEEVVEETTHRRKDGSVFPIEIHAQLLDLGSQKYGIAIDRDITERKRSEEALRAVSAYNRRLIETSLDPLLAINREGKITDVNTATEQITGRSRDELIGTHFVALSDDPQESMAGFQQAFKEGLVRNYELKIRHKTGDITPVMCNASVYHDQLGNVAGLLVAAHDITEQKLSEELSQVRLTLFEYAATHSLEELLRKTLDEIGRLTNSPIGFYHFISEDEKTILLQVWSTRTMNQFCTTEGKGRHYSVDQAGVWADCMRERRPIVHNDYSSLPHRRGLPEGHTSVIRELVVPVMKSERIVAILGIGNKPQDYTEKDVEAVYYLADVAWEIAVRKQAEEDLVRNEERYRFLVESTGLGTAWIGPDFKIRMANTTMVNMFDKSLSEFIGKECYQEFEKRDTICPHCPGVRTMSTGQPAEVETQGVRDDGTRLDIILRTFPTRGRDGAITGFIEIVEDVTERKQKDADLWESEQQYRSLFEDSIDGVYSVRWDGTIIDANSSFCGLFGYTKDDMIFKDIEALYLDPADHKRFRKEIEEKRYVRDYEVKLLKRDGTEVDCMLTTSVLHEKDGSTSGYRGIVRDLTASKALQRQLFQAQKMEAIGTLAGGISHDFNNILTVIVGFSELLLADTDEKDPSYSDLQKINQAGQNGADLVSRILTFSRKSNTNPHRLNLNRQIEQVEKLLARTLPKMIEFKFILSDELATLNADPVQLEQILMNLAINAKDAMPDGGTLTIGTKNVMLDEEFCKQHAGAMPGDYVLCFVSDTGHGMGEETLQHIFEPFYTTKEVGKGTGLGLAVVYGIVKQHGGYITCYSKPGLGTTFELYFPVMEMAIDHEISKIEPMPPPGSETILLVDDEEFIRDLGKRILEQSGYTVLTSPNGEEALSIYNRERHKISLVILDLMMPKMGGKQCLEELLRINPQVKVLIASGFNVQGETRTLLAAKAKGLVSKPFNVKELLRSLRKVLDGP
jgi:PAS domain S-box-containing protein